MAAARSGLSAAGYGHARHRGPGEPALRPSVPLRPALLSGHFPVQAGVALLLLLVCIAGWRLSQEPSTGASEQTSTPSGSSTTRSRVDIGDAGEVHVVMDLHFGAPVQELTLQVPTDAGADGAFQPTVEVGGGQVTLEETLEAGESVSVPLGSKMDQVRLEYDATGTFVASTPSQPGRGLVLLTALTVVEGETLSMLEVVDARVLNLGCVGADELRACGMRHGNQWIARPVEEAVQVIAQVDLEPS